MAGSIFDPKPGDPDRLYGVSELAEELGVTVRAIRFYEDKKLLAPGRAGANRVYTHRDRARLVLILRGKRIGLSLQEIKVFLSLYHADPNGEVQLRSLLSMLGEHISSLENQREAVETTLADLRRMQRTVQADLASGRGADRKNGQGAASRTRRGGAVAAGSIDARKVTGAQRSTG